MQSLLEYLQQYPDAQKRPIEIRQLISECLEQIPFFSDFIKNEKIKANAKHQLKEFSNYLQLEEFNVGDFIFMAGDRGDKFYIVLSGQVEVYKRKQDDSVSPTKTKLHDFYDTHIKIGIVREGGTFGELALQFNKPRFATVKALTIVKLCSLSKENFVKINNYQQRELQVKTQALQLIFPNLNQNALIRLGYSMQIVVYPAKYCIYKEGQKPAAFYIISDGEVKLEQLKKSTTQIFVPISILTAGSLFGVQEIVSKKLYDHNAYCMNQVTAYRFSAEAYDQLGDELGAKALAAASKSNPREPKIQKFKFKSKQGPIISLRALTEETEPPIAKNGYISKHEPRPVKFTRSPKFDITFRTPFFSDLDADNFKQIKKITIDQEKQHNHKKYIEQFAVSNYFQPINWGSFVEDFKRREQNKTIISNRIQSPYAFPTQGFSTHSSRSSRTVATLFKKKQ
ncbi:hypothetical protein pb186bvf_006185 [Paramecium bursaria]